MATFKARDAVYLARRPHRRVEGRATHAARERAALCDGMARGRASVGACASCVSAGGCLATHLAAVRVFCSFVASASSSCRCALLPVRYD